MLVKEYGRELLRNFAWPFFPVGHSLFSIIRFYLWKISSLFRKIFSYSIWLYSSGTCTQSHWGTLAWLCWLRGQLACWTVMKPALWFLVFQLLSSASVLDLVLMLYKLIVNLESLGDFRRSELVLYFLAKFWNSWFQREVDFSSSFCIQPTLMQICSR